MSLTVKEDRLRALALSGARVAVVPFTRELAALDHVGFFEGVLAPYLDMRAIHVGVDFRLGAHGASTVEVMSTWGRRRGVDVKGHELLSDARGPITATRIRSMIAGGRVEEAALDLGRRPFVRGVVKPGRGQGTGMGFPTANIEVPGGMQMPADGVYAGFAQVGGKVWPSAINVGVPPMFADSIASARLEAVPGGMQMPADGVYAGFAQVGGKVWPSAINVGVPPMFADSIASARLEANLVGYRGDLYGERVAIAFDRLAFDRLLRPSRTFDSVDDLICAVNRDIATVQAWYGDEPVEIG